MSGSRWTAVRALSLLWQHFRQGYAALPGSCIGRWRRAVVVGAAGLFALMGALRLAAEAALVRGWLDWEPRFLEWLGRAPVGLSDAVFIQTFGSDITLVILVAAVAAAAAWSRRPLTALSTVLALGVTDVVVRFGWLIWDRARPDVLYGGVASPGFHSFPSGHAAKTAAVYGLLAILWARSSASRTERALALTLALLIAVLTAGGRVAMGVHWPSDAVAGLLLGGCWAGVLGWALHREGTARGASDDPGA